MNESFKCDGCPYNDGDMCHLFEQVDKTNCLILKNDPRSEQIKTIRNYVDMLIRNTDKSIESITYLIEHVKRLDDGMEELVKEDIYSSFFPGQNRMSDEAPKYEALLVSLRSARKDLMYVRAITEGKINPFTHFLLEPITEGTSRRKGKLITQILIKLGYSAKEEDVALYD